MRTPEPDTRRPSDRFEQFSSDFSDIRQLPGLAYFDKTEYIPVLEKGSLVQLVCRPRRFGKSLTVSVLQYFHGCQFRNQYDQALSNLPIIQSGVNITRIEVWVTNRTSVGENTRDILAFTDLSTKKCFE